MSTNRFQLSSRELTNAQERLRKKEVFKVNDSNYKDYEQFILGSYESTINITERSEYARSLEL